jgi:hypothetical protein
MNPHDRAEAKAELKLRKQLDAYRFNKGKDVCPPLVKDVDGCLLPVWITYAVEYARKVVRAYAREILDPAASEPNHRVKLIEDYQQRVADYLFGEYFSPLALLWNIRPKKGRHNDELHNEIDQATFGHLVLTHGTSVNDGIAEWVYRAVTRFWKERTALVNANHRGDTRGGDGSRRCAEGAESGTKSGKATVTSQNAPDRPDLNQRPKPGPQPNYVLAAQVAEVVRSVVGNQAWVPKLDDICEALDDREIPRPKTWKARGYLRWYTAAVAERSLVVKAITHHLQLSKVNQKTLG